MRITLVLISIISSVSAMYDSAASQVETLTAANFETVVLKSEQIWYVQFYAQGQEESKAIEANWDSAAEMLKGVVRFGAIDCDVAENKEFAGQYEVESFPTIKMFGLDKKRLQKNYEGVRDFDTIIQYVLSSVDTEVNSRFWKKKSKAKASANETKSSSDEEPSISQVVVLDETNFEELVMNSKDIWMVEFYAPWCGHCKTLEPHWETAARKLKGLVKLGKMNTHDKANEHFNKRFGVDGYPFIKVFGYGPKNDSASFQYPREKISKDIIDFGKDLAERADLDPEVHEITSQKVFNENCKGTTICVITFLPNIFDSSAKERNDYLETLRSVSQKNRKNPFNYFWLSAGDQLDLERNLGLGFGFPAVVLVQPKKKQFGIMRSSFSAKNMNEFLNDTLHKGMRLEALPQDMKFKKTDKWNGKDAPKLEAEEDAGSSADQSQHDEL